MDTIKINFYTIIENTTIEKGEFIGTVVYRNGKLTINVNDPKLENILTSDFIAPGGKAEEITLPSGKKVLRGGVKMYKSGTLEHLQVIVNQSYSLGYIAEIEK